MLTLAIHRLAKFPESRLSESRKGFPKVIRLTVGVAAKGAVPLASAIRVTDTLSQLV